MNNHLTSSFFGLKERTKFIDGIQEALNALEHQAGIYTGDNLFTYNRNLGFLQDEPFMRAFKAHSQTEIEKAVLWRISTQLWGFRNGLRLEGDFVECACYKGIPSRIICDTVDFKKYKDRHYYLYDLFEHDSSMPHHALPEHGKDLYEQVRGRFAEFDNVTVTKGRVPDVLAEVAPQKIAFMHLDMNNAGAEISALEVLFERMVPGAILILDDYGWLYYREQKLAEDPWFAKYGYRVLELPTGQGLLVK